MDKESTNPKQDKNKPNVKMVENPFQVEEVYVDGVSGMMARGGVIKLDCYRVVGIDPKGKSEVRQMTHRLVMPSSAIPELMKVMQGTVSAANANKEKDQSDVGIQ